MKIIMVSDENFNEIIWWVLQELAKEERATPMGEDVYFEYQLPDDLIPKKEDQKRALRFLHNKKAIRLISYKYPKPFDFEYIAEMMGIKPVGCFLKILRPNFNKIYRRWRKSYESSWSSTPYPSGETVGIKEIRKQVEKIKFKNGIKKEILKEINRGQQLDQENNKPGGKPYTGVKKGKGYFKFHKQGENIKIGKPNTRHFRLLQCLCEPHFGIPKTIEAIFEAIKLPKDKNDSDLEDWSPQRKTRMLTIIEYTKKELQKNKKLRGKIKYKFDDRKNSMWLELEE